MRRRAWKVEVQRIGDTHRAIFHVGVQSFVIAEVEVVGKTKLEQRSADQHVRFIKRMFVRAMKNVIEDEVERACCSVPGCKAR